MSNTISFEIKALQSDATTPIPNAEIQLENINLGQKHTTNTNGIASFSIESKEYLKPFRAKLIHKDYQEYPIRDRVIILNSIRRQEKPLELRFKKKDSLSLIAIEYAFLNPIPQTQYHQYKNPYHSMQINLKAIYNTEDEKYKEQYTETQWGFYVANIYNEILQDFTPLMDKSNIPLKGQNISFTFKEEWLNKNIVFVAFLENNKEERVILETSFLHLYDPSLQDTSFDLIGGFLLFKIIKAFGIKDTFHIDKNKSTENLTRVVGRSEKRVREDIKQYKIKERAMQIKNQLNNGKNSVSMQTDKGYIRYDLDGKSHFDKGLGKYIETPHKVEYTKNINPADSSKFGFKKGATKPIEQSDLDIIENFLKKATQ